MQCVLGITWEADCEGLRTAEVRRPPAVKRGGHARGQEEGQVVPIPATVREAKFQGSDGEEKARLPAH